MHWIIEDIFGDETQKLIEHVDSYQIIPPGQRIFNKLTFDSNNMVRGSVDFVQQHRHPFLQPINTLTLQNYNCSKYYPRMKNLLNSNCIFMPWKMLYENEKIVFNCFPFTQEFFIRPNSGYKVFTGTTLTKKWWHRELEIIHGLPSSDIHPDTLVLITDVKNIVKEYRVLVHENEIIDCCMYSENKEDQLQSDKIEIFNHVKSNKYFPDVLFTMDIAFLYSGYSRILEINSFVSAGLYDMDYSKVVKSVERILTQQ